MKTALWVLLGALVASGAWYWYDYLKPENRLVRTEQSLYREKIKQAEAELAAGKTSQALQSYTQSAQQHQQVLDQIKNPFVQPPNQPTSSFNNITQLLAQLPPTPRKVTCAPAGANMRCEWPIQSNEWVMVTKLQPNVRVEADPEGKLIDKKFPKYGPTGPAGLNYLCPDPQLRSREPAPDAPPYALIVKLGKDGEPTALAGRYGKSLVTTEQVDLYVRINDVQPITNEGSLPIIIKSN